MIQGDYNGYKVFLVETSDDIKFVKSLMNDKVKTGLDTETHSLTYRKGEIVGVCMSAGKSYSKNDYCGFYLPIRHMFGKNLPEKEVFDLVQYQLDNFDTVFWNRPFDASMLETEGIKIPFIGRTHDAQIMRHLAFSESYPALKDTAKSLLGFDVIEFSDNNAKNHDFGTTDPSVSYIYAAQDAIVTVLLARKMWADYPYIRKIYPLDNLSGEAVRRMGQSECWLDYDVIQSELNKTTIELSSIKSQIFSITGYEFNLDSNPEKAEALCFSEDTEFLTEKGFMKYDDITTEKLAQLNETTKEVEFVIPEGRISRTSKEMYHINHRYTDLFVTSGHKMYVALDKDDYKLLSINDIADKKRGFRVKNTVNTVGVERTEPFIFESRKGDTRYKKLVIPADAFIEFLGFWYGDGHSTISSYKKKDGSVHTTYKVGFTQSTCKEKADTVKWLLELNQRMGNIFGVSKRAERYDFQCAFKVFAEYIENCCKVNKVKTIPLWIRGLSVRQRRLFLDGYLRADGTFNGANVFLSSNLEMLKELRYLSVTSGRKCSSIRIKTEEGSVKSVKGVDLKHESKPMYIFSSTIRFDYSHITPNDIEFVEDYNGRVVCFQVPSSILVVRRNGKVSVCGNCRFVTLTKKTKGGKFKVDEDTLSEIDHPLADLLGRYAKTKKYISTYLQKMLGWKDTVEHIRVHYSAVNALSGRLSSGGASGNDYYVPFNIQNVPKIEVKGYVHRGGVCGYYVNGDTTEFIPSFINDDRAEDTGLNIPGYQIITDDGKEINLPYNTQVKVRRNNKELCVLVQDLREDDELI